MKDSDIETFRLHRSRIPTALFKSIVQDIDIMLVQYGPPIEHGSGKISVPVPSECEPTPHTANKLKLCPQIFNHLDRCIWFRF
jgi:hypothetical protein